MVTDAIDELYQEGPRLYGHAVQPGEAHVDRCRHQAHGQHADRPPKAGGLRQTPLR
jgi:hypothetical protein